MSRRAGNAFGKLVEERYEKHRNDSDRKFIIPTEAELKASRAAVQQIYDEWVKGTPNGQQKLDALQKILADIRAKS
jgi:TRAP-type C4-dicarboxylate transport system substrate-binding protein